MHGDFGWSMAARGNRVNDIIKNAFPVSLDLGIRSMIVAIVLGLFFGIIAALNRGKPMDYLTVILVLIGISVPSFVIAAFLQYFFGVYLHILPVARYDTFKHTLLPTFALSLGTMATLARYMRASMLEVMMEDYIKTAKAKGLNYLAVATLDVGEQLVDQATGQQKVYVRVNGYIWDLNGKFIKKICSVGPVQYSGLGEDPKVAKTNALINAGTAAAKDLVDQLRVKQGL